jgi:hypothetical protein
MALTLKNLTLKDPAQTIQEAAATFAPFYYDTQITQTVLAFDATASDTLTATITAGSPYFTIKSLTVSNLISAPTTPSHPIAINEVERAGVLASGSAPGVSTSLSGPVETSDGATPIPVKQGQYVQLQITANVPKGSSLPAGKFTGTVVVSGQTTNESVPLNGTYLGSLIGKVTVQPATVSPGQSVLIQVNDAAGNILSDESISVAIQGVPCKSRYYQFPTIGSRNLIITAVRGALSESALATINVAGPALEFRTSITLPNVFQMPLLQVSSVPGNPYAASISLGNTNAVRRVLANEVAQEAVAHGAAAQTHAAVNLSNSVAVATDSRGAEFAKALTNLPAAQIVRTAPVSVKTATGVGTSSAVFAEVGELTTPPTATSYTWDFGDGQTATTQSPIVTHNYFSAMSADDVTRGFDISCTVVHDNITVKRTLVLHSAYGLCKRRGVLVPPVTGTTYATFQQIAFSASLIVTNLESMAITLSSSAVVPFSDTGSISPPSPQFVVMKTPVVIAGQSATALGVYVPLSQLQLTGAATNGFTVYYSGSMTNSDGSTTPVRFSYAFRIPLSDSGITGVTLPSQLSPGNWNFAGVLQAISGAVTQGDAAVSKPGAQTIDTSTNTVAIALTSNASELNTLIQARSAVQAGLTSIALKTGALTSQASSLRLTSAIAPKAAPVSQYLKYDPLNPPPVADGNDCYPDDISDSNAASAAAQQLVCQLTGDTQTASIPSSFQNAQQGDIILSPAPVNGGDLIAALFRALTPPQHHGHSGMMTANFFEITHCTASPDRIMDNLNNDVVGIPESLNSAMLQYGWPGSLTQSVDSATTTQSYIDPGGTSYTLNSFNSSSQGDGFEIIPPLVIKPLPENEAAVRPLLRQAAETARSKGAQYDSNGNMTQKGGCYYSFYAYTNPQLSAGFGDAAGADAGWAEGLSPAVCSSFVWMSLKENNVPLVSTNQYEELADFSQTAIAGGVQVGAQTLDGLVYYPQAERLQGAQALYQMVLNLALSKEYGFGTLPLVDESIAGPIADQLINDFASGNPNLAGSTSWQTPGDGNAVSPDNIIWWNPPYYGYAEPLQYLPTHTEQYSVSKWVKVISWGTIIGKVTYNGAPVPNAHVWVYIPGGDTYTAADGSFTLNHVPIGPYSLTAQAVITTNGVSGEYSNGMAGQNITLTANNSNLVQNIELAGDPVNYREIDFTYSISCDHGDNNPWDATGIQNQGPFSQSIDVNPGNPTNGLTYSFDYNGGGYFHIDYVFTISLLIDLSIELTLTGTMYDDGSGSVQDQYSITPLNIPMGGTWSGSVNIEHTNGYHNGPAIFTFSVANNQQTG